MAKSATHAGHCQACGRLQKLPGGQLSLHGYNVRFGFFSGTCVGSRELPYEKSCDLIRGFVRRAQDDLKRVEGQQRHLRRWATEPKAMLRVWVRPSGGFFRQGGNYEWQQHEIKIHTLPGGSVRFYRGDEYRGYGMDANEVAPAKFGETDVLAVATHHNRIYADWLEHEADSLRRYIAWQERRIAEWQPREVLPIGAQDREGFEPTKPKY